MRGGVHLTRAWCAAVADAAGLLDDDADLLAVDGTNAGPASGGALGVPNKVGEPGHHGNGVAHRRASQAPTSAAMALVVTEASGKTRCAAHIALCGADISRDVAATACFLSSQVSSVFDGSVVAASDASEGPFFRGAGGARGLQAAPETRPQAEPPRGAAGGVREGGGGRQRGSARGGAPAAGAGPAGGSPMGPLGRPDPETVSKR